MVVDHGSGTGYLYNTVAVSVVAMSTPEQLSATPLLETSPVCEIVSAFLPASERAIKIFSHTIHYFKSDCAKSQLCVKKLRRNTTALSKHIYG